MNRCVRYVWKVLLHATVGLRCGDGQRPALQPLWQRKEWKCWLRAATTPCSSAECQRGSDSSAQTVQLSERSKC